METNATIATGPFKAGRPETASGPARIAASRFSPCGVRNTSARDRSDPRRSPDGHRIETQAQPPPAAPGRSLVGDVGDAVASSRRDPTEEENVNGNRGLAALAAVVGVVLIVVAVVYWVEPAGSLPGFFPGHAAGSSHHHAKHGIASFLVGLALLVYAWFQTAPPKRAAAE